MALMSRLSISFINFMSGGSASGACSTIKEGVVNKMETDEIDGWWTMVDQRSGGGKIEDQDCGFWTAR